MPPTANRTRSRFWEIAIVLAVLVISALVARNYMSSPPTANTRIADLRTDIKESLVKLCEIPNIEVTASTPGNDSIPPSDNVIADVTVTLPLGMQKRPPEWLSPTVLFVARRHPRVTLSRLKIIDSATSQEFVPSPISAYAQNVGRAQKTSSSERSGASQPARAQSQQDFEASRAAYLAQEGQRRLNTSPEIGPTLLLVKCTAGPGRSPYDFEDMPRIPFGHHKRHLGRYFQQPRQSGYHIEKLDAYVILDPAADPLANLSDKVRADLQPVLKLKDNRGDTWGFLALSPRSTSHP